jgi:hypothetical protein
MKKIMESLDYQDFAGQINYRVSVDEYSAKIGTDDEIVTLSFIVKGSQASKDLVDWFERGYNFIIDAAVSEGELIPGKYVVFVEMRRRTKVPDQIYELLEDLETLTDLKVTDWTVTVNDEDYDCDVEQLKQVIVLSPHEYRKEKETELNEMREMSGVPTKNIFTEKDTLLKDFLSKAGL